MRHRRAGRRLTAKQEGFARDVAAGKDQTTAYRNNYNTKTAREQTVHDNAHKVAKNTEVAQRIKEHEDRAFDDIDRGEWVLSALKNMALTAKTESSKVKAIELIGKSIGLFLDKTEYSREARLTNEEIVQDLSQGDPVVADMLRKRLGD